MAAPVDSDWEFLDRVIALAMDVIDRANQIKDRSDDPDVVYWALLQESAGLVVRRTAADYRQRLRQLKEMEKARVGRASPGYKRERDNQ